MQNIFEQAARKSIRFNSVRGLLTTEQVFELPLTSKSGFDLDTVARAVNTELKALGEESFVETRTNPAKAIAELKLEVVKFIIADKIETIKAATERAKANQEVARIEELIANKKDEQLAGKSVEELEAALAAARAKATA